MSGLLCAGDVYIDRFDDAGASTGLVYLFDAKQFAIEEPSEAKVRTSRGRADYGQAKDIVYVKGASTIAMTGDEVSARVLGLALLGNVAALTQSSGTVTDEPVTLKKDVYVQLPHLNIDESGVVLTDSAGVVTYVEDTDYKMIRRLGWIMALTTAAATAGNKLSYAYSAATGDEIAGGSKPIVRCRLVLDGVNLATQKSVIVDVDEARIAPSSEVDFASDEYVSVELAGTLITQPGKTRPYTVKMLG